MNQANITQLLHAWRDGDRSAESELMRVTYPILRDLASARAARMAADTTLRATELVNEAYLRLAGASIEWEDRAHFYAVTARAIRNIIVDYVRAQSTEKRGGDLPFTSLDVAAEEATSDTLDLRVDWLCLHEALNELEALNTHVAYIVELKFFSGLTNEEIAEVTHSSRSAVVRDWRFARTWLATRLGA